MYYTYLARRPVRMLSVNAICYITSAHDYLLLGALRMDWHPNNFGHLRRVAIYETQVYFSYVPLY